MKDTNLTLPLVISGKVVKGDGYGRKLGFPTVNLDITQGSPVYNTEALPPEGVYVGVAMMEGKEYRAGIVVGPNAKIEAHLIGYAGDAYGKEVSLHLKNFLREYKKFDTEEELISQIKEDISKC